jgi:DMSO/TMAO reductase YedYZ molybdopterin-dependent catalytic subunit
VIELALLYALVTAPARGFSLSVSGDGMKAENLSIADLKKLKHVDVTVHGVDGDKVYEGAAVIDVLKSAGLKLTDHPGKAMSAYVSVSASDGYQVVFGLGELVPDISGRTVIAAYSVDGKPLPEGVGPIRVVVEGDKMQARSIRSVSGLKLVQLRK